MSSEVSANPGLHKEVHPDGKRGIGENLSEFREILSRIRNGVSPYEHRALNERLDELNEELDAGQW